MVDGSRPFDGNQINWNQVFYFYRIAAHGSLKGAARELRLSASTLSEHLIQLERDLDVPLFLRAHRKLTLTPPGTRLYRHAKTMFEAGQRLLDVISPVPLGCYPVSVGMVPGQASWMAYPTIGAYVTDFGAVDMKLSRATHDEIEQALAETRLDFGFSDRISQRRDVVARLIVSSPVRFFVGGRWRDRTLAELVTELPLLLPQNDSTTREFVDRRLADLGLSARSTVISEYPGLLRALCESGRGIGIFNEAMAAEATGLHLVPLPAGATSFDDRLYALWARDGENSEAVQRLRVLLGEQELGEEVPLPAAEAVPLPLPEITPPRGIDPSIG